MRTNLAKAYDWICMPGPKETRLERAKGHAAFAGHYIADAFSAGHLINKDEVMERARETIADGFGEGAGAVLDNVATAIARDGADEIAQWQVRSPAPWRDVKTGDLRFLLPLVRVASPDAFYGGIVRAIHDALGANELGEAFVEVSSAGETWLMGGDGHLDDTSKRVCSSLIAQTMEHLEALSDNNDHISKEGLLNFVEQGYPTPTPAGQESIQSIVEGVFGGMEPFAGALAAASVAELPTIFETVTDNSKGALAYRRAEDG